MSPFAQSETAGHLPVVSILSPSLNQVDFVAEMLSSVYCQDYPYVEHVLVDAGSTDGTLAVVDKMNNGRTIIDNFLDSSQSQALNKALSLATGDIIGWLNTDDAYFTTDVISSVVSMFGGNESVVVVYGYALSSDEAGRALKVVTPDVSLLRYATPTSPIVQPSAFIRRSALERRFVRDDLHLRMDQELWIWLSTRGEFAELPRILSVDRDHPRRKTRDRSAEGVEELEMLQAEYGLELYRSGTASEIIRKAKQRIAGLPDQVSLERKYPSRTFSVKEESPIRRAVRQLALPQKYLRSL